MSGKYFFIRSKMHGKVVDVEGGSPDMPPGTSCIVWHSKDANDPGNANQLFYECPLTGTIRSKLRPDMCLDVNDDDGSIIVNTVQYGDRDQAWDRANDMVINRQTGKALDICGKEEHDGAKLLAYDIHGEINQKWDFDYQPPRYFFIVSLLNDKVLDVGAKDSSPGAKVIMWHRKDDISDADNQLWYEDNNGFIRSKLNDFILDTEGGDLHLEPYEPGKESQRFCFDCESRCIRCVECRDDVLDIKGECPDDGACVCRWGFKDGEHQKWRLDYI